MLFRHVIVFLVDLFIRIILVCFRVELVAVKSFADHTAKAVEVFRTIEKAPSRLELGLRVAVAQSI